PVRAIGVRLAPWRRRLRIEILVARLFAGAFLRGVGRFALGQLPRHLLLGARRRRQLAGQVRELAGEDGIDVNLVRLGARAAARDGVVVLVERGREVRHLALLDRRLAGQVPTVPAAVGERL